MSHVSFLQGWEEKLEEMVKIRTLARQRETTIGELVLGAARGAPPPPHPDQWLPTAEHQRHEDEVKRLFTPYLPGQTRRF